MKLTDNQICTLFQAIGSMLRVRAETIRGRTAVEALEKVRHKLWLALLTAHENEARTTDPTSPTPPPD